MLVEIKGDVGSLNAKFDSLKGVNNKADKALEISKENQEQIKNIKAGNSNHSQWWLAIIPAIIGGLAGALPTWIH